MEVATVEAGVVVVVVVVAAWGPVEAPPSVQPHKVMNHRGRRKAAEAAAAPHLQPPQPLPLLLVPRVVVGLKPSTASCPMQHLQWPCTMKTTACGLAWSQAASAP